MSIELRDYQQAAIGAIYDFFKDRRGDGCLVVAPTGAGKSVIIGQFIKTAIEQYPQTRILVVTHVKELIQQNVKAMLRQWPQANIGIYSAGLNRKEVHRQITFAGVQSIARNTRAIGHVDLVVVDEAHLIPRKSDTLYGKLFTALRQANPYLKIIGLTATPYRLDSGSLVGGDDALFDGIAYDIPISMLVERGYLSPLVAKRPAAKIDLHGIKTKRGDYDTAQSEAAAMAITEAACDEIVALGRDRHSWLAFCVTVDHAHEVAEALRKRGIKAGVVTGDTNPAERARLIEEFKTADLRCLVSVGVLTTGFDAPETDLIAMLRPTQSTGLYMQIMGRGMRIAPEKSDCLVLDFAGNVMRHGPVDLVPSNPGHKKKAKPTGEDDDPTFPAKACPECDFIAPVALKVCRNCGYEWPDREIEHDTTASAAPVMTITAPPEQWEPVQDVEYKRHSKYGSPDSLRVTYLVGGRPVSEWVCFEHVGYARQKAVQWWSRHAGTTPPDDVTEAMERLAEVRAPDEVVIAKDGKFERIKRVRFAQSEAA